MSKLLLLVLFLLIGCAGGSYSTSLSKEDGGQFDPDTCANMPLSIEEYQALGSDGKIPLIKCSDLERCASISG
jgi:hypothetical protein